MLKCNVSSHAAKLNERRCRMDCRVKPGNDELKILAAPVRASQADGDRRIENGRYRRRSLRCFAVSIHCKKNKKAKEAERRQTQGVLSEPRERMLPLARASGPARAEAQRARLSAFRRGTCGGERTPPLNSSPRFLGPGVIGCYPHLACPFSPASCLAVPVVVPDGRIRRSRPGAR
jgi:hypothetical protein